MTDTRVLLDSIVKVLRSMPEFCAALALGGSGEADITAYPLASPTARSLNEAVQEMAEPSAMVSCRGMALGQRGSIPQFQFHFVVNLRAAGEADEGSSPGYWNLLNLLVEDVPADSGGMRFIDSVVCAGFDPPEDFSFTPAVDAKGTEYWQFNFSLIAQGG